MVLRKDTSYARGTSVGQRRLTDEQFEKVQKVGRVKLSPALRRQLDDALVWYPLNLDSDLAASTREDQSKNLRKALDCVIFLRQFLNKSTGDHSVYGAREHIEEELSLLREEKDFEKDWAIKNDILNAGIYITELKKRIAESNRKKNYTIIDFELMRKDFAFWEFAMKSALKKFEDERGKDKGGHDEDISLNTLLLKLRNIYDRATGSKKAFEKFYQSVIETLPKNIRPSMPKGVDSISKRANRIQKKHKEFLANRSKTKRKSS